MWVELLLPEEVMPVLPPDEVSDRGPSDITIALEVVGTISNVATVAQVVGAAPELARRIRSWLQSRRGNEDVGSEAPRLVVKGPGVHVELDLPRNVPSERIVAALIAALEPAQTHKVQAKSEDED